MFETVAKNVGTIEAIIVGQGGECLRPSWFLEHLEVQNLRSGERVRVAVQQWFKPNEGDAVIERRVYPTGADEADRTAVLTDEWEVTVASGNCQLFKGQCSDCERHMIFQLKCFSTLTSSSVPIFQMLFCVNLL